MKKTLLLFIPCLLLIFVACKKNNSNNDNKVTTVASLIYGGEPAADGVGWFIKLQDSSAVHPNNLPQEFQQTTSTVRQAVKITFEYTGEKYQTGMMVSPGMPVIKLHSIVKQ